jgi:hypothetical protein
MVRGSARGRLVPPPDAEGAGEPPGQPLQAESSTSAGRSARSRAGRIGVAEHATAQGPGSRTFVQEICAARGGRTRFHRPTVSEGGVASGPRTRAEGNDGRSAVVRRVSSAGVGHRGARRRGRAGRSVRGGHVRRGDRHCRADLSNGARGAAGDEGPLRGADGATLRRLHRAPRHGPSSTAARPRRRRRRSRARSTTSRGSRRRTRDGPPSEMA